MNRAYERVRYKASIGAAGAAVPRLLEVAAARPGAAAAAARLPARRRGGAPRGRGPPDVHRAQRRVLRQCTAHVIRYNATPPHHHTTTSPHHRITTPRLATDGSHS